MLKSLKIAHIKLGTRHRKDMGDLQSLADSIKEEGLLQPIGVTEKFELVFGERRLRAHKEILKRNTILARIVDVSSILAGEYAENEIRKDFTPSERVQIANALEKQLPNRNGVPKARQKIDKLRGQRTDNYVAAKAGFGNHQTYRQAAKVVKNGTSRLIQAMDSGRVSISAASILVDADIHEQEAVLELDKRAILQAAKEIRAKQAEQRAKHQELKTPKPQARSNKLRFKATQLIHGDCRKELRKLPDQFVDLIVTDPPYPEISREYGRLSEADWHDLMKVVVIEGRRVLKPSGSMVIILQPNFEKIGKMRLWLWEFVAWAGREWNLVQDVYWWSYDCLPLAGTRRKEGLLRSSVKTCVWLGLPNCYRNQDRVLWLPSDANFAESRETRALRSGPSGRTYIWGNMTESVENRGGSTPFNLLPVAAGGSATSNNGHPSKTPYDVAAWWVKYLLPQSGVLLDCFAGSGTMLKAGLDFGAAKVIGIEEEKNYIKIAEKVIVGE
jgi:ParB-like chromosome segregation protein Spo0J